MAKKAGFLGTDDLQTIDYNNDVTLDDLETVDFNDDTQMTDLTFQQQTIYKQLIIIMM